MNFKGRNGDELLFATDSKAVVVNEASNLVIRVGDSDSLIASFTIDGDQTTPTSVPFELAVAASTDLDIKVFGNTDRLYTIPKSVVSEANRGLTWFADNKRGATPVGLSTALSLVAGGQIDIKKIRHIAKYFPRHEADKTSGGYELGQISYPSNGRIGWALWGGDAGKEWAISIVEREDRKAQQDSITASFGYVMSEYDDPAQIDLSSFNAAQFLPDDTAPQFYIRVRLDGSGIDRLYKVDPTGYSFVWDDSMWEDLGGINYDLNTYDLSLDGPQGPTSYIHVLVDVDTAITVSGLLDADPMGKISIDTLDPDGAQIMADELPSMDWSDVDDISYGVEDNYLEYYEYEEPLTSDAGPATPVAAPAVTSPRVPSTGGQSKGDGTYTPAERSSNASVQVRDSSGKFSKEGGSVVIGGNPNYTGVVKSIDPQTQSVKVQLTNGKFVDVPANLTQDATNFNPPTTNSVPKSVAQSLTKGILADPKAPVDTPAAKLLDGASPISQNQLKTILSDWSLWAADARAKGATSSPTANAYNDPSLRNFLDNKVTLPNGSVYQPDSMWFRPTTDSEIYVPNSIEDYIKNPNLGAHFSISASGEEVPTPTPTTDAVSDNTSLTPETSDVPPIYMAIISPDDPTAVMDLIALIPASKISTTPITFRRKPGKWEQDQTILNDLDSPTPPPVVVLDNDMLTSVLTQIDTSVTASISPVDALIASALSRQSLDVNKTNSSRLKNYWLFGKGAEKIRWNTDGDWTRCTKQLSKYMGFSATGYCALRHLEATGSWVGDKGSKQFYVTKGDGKKIFSNELIIPLNAVIASASLKAQAANISSRFFGTTEVDTPDPTPTEQSPDATDAPRGASFSIPLVIPEGVETGDGRKFAKGSITMRNLPLPLLWQIKSDEGHNGSVVVGQIVTMERTDEGIGNATGYFDTGEFGQEAERLVRGRFIRGVSADMDMFEADGNAEVPDEDSENKIGGEKMNITQGRVMAVTIVPKPAFQECIIYITDDATPSQEENDVITDGVYVDGVNALDASALLACGLVAGMIPVVPPRAWFNDPKLNKPTPLTVTDDGQVFGHIAAWHTDHIGMAYGTHAPKSKSKYAYFHTGVVRTDDNTDVPVGQLTLAGGHASLGASASQAARHYDDTASAIADVHAGEDKFGIWVSGSLRPGATPEQIRTLRASAPSGDWRPIKGSLELVAVCQVNVPGFPVARSRVASGQIMALVAAGAAVLAELKSDPLADLSAKVDRLEKAANEPIVAAATKAKSRMETMTAAISAQNLSNRVKAMRDEDAAYMLQTLGNGAEFATVGMKERMKLAKSGDALPDGSFPIRNGKDLKNAVHAYGRAKPSDKAKVRRHIAKRAKALDMKHVIPKDWKEAPADNSDSMSLRDRIAIVKSVVAAGGLDRNRGNAENLRQYWVHGKGALKIRWGEGGDWARCVRHLSKYLGIRAKGYCQLRHKDALGIYTATHAKELHGHLSNMDGMDDVENVPSPSEDLPISDDDSSTFPTQVTDNDMSQTMDQICNAPDDGFDPNWEPDPEIIILLEDPSVTDQDSDNSYDPDNDGDDDSGDGGPDPDGDGMVNPLNPPQASSDNGQLLAVFAAGEAQGAPVDSGTPSLPAPVDSKTPDATKADLEGLTPAEKGILKTDIAQKQDAEKDDRVKYTPETQPRDDSGKFRDVLARLKLDLGVDGSQEAIEQIKKTENLNNAGNYIAAAKGASDLIGMLNQIEDGSVDKKSSDVLQATTSDLGKIISNLPFNFIDQAQKIRFSDVPPVLQSLMTSMADRVVQKLGAKSGAVQVQSIKDFMSGQLMFSQSDISKQMSTMLGLLT